MKRIISVLGLLAMMVCLLTVPAAAQAEDDLSLPQWVGHEFVTLDLPQDRQQQGYNLYAGQITTADLRADNVDNIPRSSYEHRGRHVVIDQVEAAQWENEQYYVVRMTEKESNQQLTARSFNGQVDSLALAADLSKIRDAFLGKTIYAKRTPLIGIPNPVTVLPTYGQAMQVKDAWFGFDVTTPILLVVEIDNTKAALPTPYSWTNQYPGQWRSDAAWEKNFSSTDPHQVAGNSPEIWAAIVDSQVKEGMNDKQVRLSWGSPKKIDKNEQNGIAGEIWTYGNYRLNFVNNTLTKIEKLAEENINIGTVDVPNSEANSQAETAPAAE